MPAEIDGCIEFAKDLYALFGVTPHAELSTRPENRLGTDDEWDFAEGASRRRSSGTGSVLIGEGEGTFYGPKIDLHMERRARPAWQIGHDPARRADAAPLRPHVHGRRQRRAHAGRRPPRALRIDRAVHRRCSRALRAATSRSGSRRCRCGCSRSASRTARPSTALRERLAAEGIRVDVDERDETLGRRIRDAELEKLPVRRRLRRQGVRRGARRARAGRRAVDEESSRSCSSELRGQVATL